MSDVAFADRPEQRIRDRVAKHVGVGMSLQPARMRDLDAAENRALRPSAKTVRVVTNSSIRLIRSDFKSSTPLEAMMLYLSG